MSDEPFLARWSRRKTKAKAEPPPPPVPEAKAAPPTPAPPIPELPAIESLTAQSDFSVFLKDGVPAELRQSALQRLWASDPSLMAPEVMDLHMQDYTTPAVPEVVKTAWRLGKGVLDQAELGEERKAEALAAQDLTAKTAAGAESPTEE
ncbi:conserved hypothetical protein [Candidatus Terasakiella magnetica]|nr:conserved hypothetical protein [Candidatus Terasakiella magnetica]